jgi:hypothetical protein
LTTLLYEYIFCAVLPLYRPSPADERIKPFSLLSRTRQEITKVRQRTLAPLRSLLLVATAAVIVLGATGFVIAQSKAADKYPKPDLSKVEEFWEVVDFEYDFSYVVPKLVVTAKRKKKVVPAWWLVTWRDDKGVAVRKYPLMFNNAHIQQSKMGEALQTAGDAPDKADLRKVKSIEVEVHPDSPEYGGQN